MGHIKTINFPFETNGKLMGLGVLILEPFRVCAVLIRVSFPHSPEIHIKRGKGDNLGIIFGIRCTPLTHSVVTRH